MSEFCSVKEVADKVGVGEETVRRWVRSHQLKAYKIKRRRGEMVFTNEDLKDFLKEHKFRAK